MTSTLDRYIRRPEAVRLTGLSASTLWRLEQAGEFPARIQLSKGAVGWSLGDVLEFNASRKPVANAVEESAT